MIIYFFLFEASIYFDYLNTNNFQFDGLTINQESLIQLSSITVNNSKCQISLIHRVCFFPDRFEGDTTDACSSANIAQDPVCLTSSICHPLSNPWTFNCRFCMTKKSILFILLFVCFF